MGPQPVRAAATIHLAFVTYNRLEYTRKALASILADPAEGFTLTIWDNASSDGTADYLRTAVSDPRIQDIICSKENVGQIAAVNEIWGHSNADLLGKLDNDCLVTPGWTQVLARAHADIPELGVVACWHYPPDEFDEQAARKAGKIQSFGAHHIVRHPWTCGTGLLVKRSAYRRLGPLNGDVTTGFWKRLACAGYVNGFYYPLILQEHMDDPMSLHCLVRDDRSIDTYRATTVVLRNNDIRSMSDRWGRRRVVLDNLNSGPWDVKHYVGWRAKARKIRRLFKEALAHREL